MLNKKKILKILKYLILLLVIILLVIIIIKIKNFIKSKYSYTPEIETPIIEDEGIKKLDNYTNFIMIEKAINTFLLYAQVKNTEAIYSMLEENYISSNSINLNNVFDNIKEFKASDSKFIAREIYAQEDSNNGKYYIYGILEEKNKGKNVYFEFYRDINNGTFALLPIDETTYEKGIKTDTKLKEKTININKYNKIKIEILEKEDRVIEIFNRFIHDEIYYPEYIYNKLDEDYRNARFGSLDEYKKYIKLNYNKLISMDSSSMKAYEEFETAEEYQEYLMSLNLNALEKYNIEQKDGINTYICIDDTR